MKILSKFSCTENFSKINTDFLINIKSFKFIHFNWNDNLVLIFDLFLNYFILLFLYKIHKI